MNDLILNKAKEMATLHTQLAPETIGIYMSPNSELDNLLLVEVDSDCLTTNEVLPFKFRNQATLIILSKEEWKSVKTGKLNLPNSWGELFNFITLYERDLK